MQPIGKNATVWKAKIEMQRMFKEKKLLRRTVPPNVASRVVDENKLLWGAVPPTILLTKTKVPETESGTVPNCKKTVPPNLASRKLPGSVAKIEVSLLTSKTSTESGATTKFQKSTKGTKISKKIFEMRKIWENNSIENRKCDPRIQASRPICDEPIGDKEILPVIDQPTAPVMSD